MAARSLANSWSQRCGHGAFVSGSGPGSLRRLAQLQKLLSAFLSGLRAPQQPAKPEQLAAFQLGVWEMPASAAHPVQGAVLPSPHIPAALHTFPDVLLLGCQVSSPCVSQSTVGCLVLRRTRHLLTLAVTACLSRDGQIASGV